MTGFNHTQLNLLASTARDKTSQQLAPSHWNFIEGHKRCRYALEQESFECAKLILYIAAFFFFFFFLIPIHSLCAFSQRFMIPLISTTASDLFKSRFKYVTVLAISLTFRRPGRFVPKSCGKNSVFAHLTFIAVYICPVVTPQQKPTSPSSPLWLTAARDLCHPVLFLKRFYRCAAIPGWQGSNVMTRGTYILISFLFITGQIRARTNQQACLQQKIRQVIRFQKIVSSNHPTHPLSAETVSPFKQNELSSKQKRWERIEKRMKGYYHQALYSWAVPNSWTAL